MEPAHPGFLILGAAKAGTTTLWAMLRRHPELFLPPVKEPSFFALGGRLPPAVGPAPPHVLEHLLHRHLVPDEGAYRALFRKAPPGRLSGEASVRYLYAEKAALRIRATVPEVRLIVLLRHPADRMLSHHRMNRQFVLEPLDLRTALAREADRRAASWGWDWHYAALSDYGPQLERYLEVFPREQLLVLRTEDLARDPVAVLERTCRHLGIAPRPDLAAGRREKASRRPRSTALQRFLVWPDPRREALLRLLPGPLASRFPAWLRRINLARFPPADPATREELAAPFRAGVRALGDRLDLDLESGWYGS